MRTDRQRDKGIKSSSPFEENQFPIDLKYNQPLFFQIVQRIEAEQPVVTAVCSRSKRIQQYEASLNFHHSQYQVPCAPPSE